MTYLMRGINDKLGCQWDTSNCFFNNGGGMRSCRAPVCHSDGEVRGRIRTSCPIYIHTNVASNLKHALRSGHALKIESLRLKS